ncbi:hypothetical protein [Levilactobacillus bambusae]|uniref:hypothetical protein n=1 Tax=Levilactobacillus bambusae TaxID=2024736 RepID=UPI00140401FA|nr:hypothetical protein [Levilactobacillus bambusae]
MSDLSRVTLINALSETNPNAPRAFYEAMPTETLRIEFFNIANEMQMNVREHGTFH